MKKRTQNILLLFKFNSFRYCCFCGSFFQSFFPRQTLCSVCLEESKQSDLNHSQVNQLGLFSYD